MEEETLYYRRRADEHRRFAAEALSDVARERHLELAELLAGRAAPPRAPAIDAR